LNTKSANERRIYQKDLQSWIRVKDPLRTLILETLLDPTKKKILDAVSDGSLTIPQILDACKISHAGGYRKINSLIQDNFLVLDGYTKRNYKRVNRFKSNLKDIRINIDKNKTRVEVKFTKN
jgi:DNA-binding transcriptional ArsR family regulator